MTAHAIVLSPCPKGYTRDLDKAVSPAVTAERVRARLAAAGLDVVAGTRRVDVGRLGIPVYLGLCGEDARAVMPTRKQMGKGSSEEQAVASALMEVMERFAFFSFWERPGEAFTGTWSEAEARFGAALLPLEAILRSVDDSMEPATARRILDLVPWQFYPATHLASGRITWLPLDWFRMLGEFNGSSAGNSAEESLLQGLSELVERHVCCRADRERPTLPTIDPASCGDAVLRGLLDAFEREGICLVLKDVSLGMPVPTVAALAWDPATFPDSSEIVFTAGTASSPAKAAIRAVTEVAQLAGDFCTGACYEASGLPKFTELSQAAWLLEGPTVPLSSLPSVEAPDMRDELQAAIAGLAPLEVYAVETTHPDLGIPAHYTIVPGLQFRERAKNQSLGLFVGRKLAETCDAETAERGLATLAELCPQAHYLPFFQGILALRREDPQTARELFLAALPLQPDDEAAGLAAFYAGHAETVAGRWAEAVPLLTQAVRLCPDMKEYGNLLGVALYKTGRYAEAASAFAAVLKLDKGSAMDRANLGVCLKLLGHAEQARRELAAALELDPHLDFARAHLAELESGPDAGATPPFRTLQDVLRHLDALGLFHIDLGLDRMRRVLQALNLERPPFVVVQVVGTNGKGSTSAFLDALCMAHGCRTGLYTSPHFVSPEERIRINGKPVPGAAWPAAANRIMAASGENLTYFEFLTVLALLLFREAGVEVAILEAGLGGRYDATTAVAADLVCFTPVAMDHAAVLGPTLAHIARDKAGAMRNGAPALTAPQFPAAAQALAAAAETAGTELVAAQPLAGERLPHLGLAGAHQLVNAGLALAAWHKLAPLLGKAADDAGAQAAGLKTAFLPGRLQSVPRSPDHPALILDGAHNPHGMQALLRAMDNLPAPAAIVFSCLDDKDWHTTAAMLRRHFPHVPVFIPGLDNSRAADPHDVAAFFATLAGAPATPFTGPEALGQALSAAEGCCHGDADTTLVTGSLYLLSELFARFPGLLEPSIPPSAEEHLP